MTCKNNPKTLYILNCLLSFKISIFLFFCFQSEFYVCHIYSVSMLARQTKVSFFSFSLLLLKKGNITRSSILNTLCLPKTMFRKLSKNRPDLLYYYHIQFRFLEVFIEESVQQTPQFIACQNLDPPTQFGYLVSVSFSDSLNEVCENVGSFSYKIL